MMNSRIAILLAVYEPNRKWFKELLSSLNAQEHPSLILYVYDDGSKEGTFAWISNAIKETISSFPYELIRGEKNRGSNRAFAHLTAVADADYLAYCDQDDVWLPGKLGLLHRAIEANRAALACSDVYVIDAAGRRVADSIREVRRHHCFPKKGVNLESLLFYNFAMGATMLIRADVAKEALPFCPGMVHDHYLAFYAATKGGICVVNKPTIKYRIHDHNQTALFAGITDKKSYYRIRILSEIKRLSWMKKRFHGDGEAAKAIRGGLGWLKARRALFHQRKGAMKRLLECRSFGLLVPLFESMAPEPVFRMAIAAYRRNMI